MEKEQTHSLRVKKGLIGIVKQHLAKYGGTLKSFTEEGLELRLKQKLSKKENEFYEMQSK